jgi:hypothetical protein
LSFPVVSSGERSRPKHIRLNWVSRGEAGETYLSLSTRYTRSRSMACQEHKKAGQAEAIGDVV